MVSGALTPPLNVVPVSTPDGLSALSEKYRLIVSKVITPGRWDAPRRFIAVGPYRWVRKPIYLAGLRVALGEAWLFMSPPLPVYAVAAAVLLSRWIPRPPSSRTDDRLELAQSGTTLQMNSIRIERDRPRLERGGAAAQEAKTAAARFVEELQSGWDLHDADVSNRHFAADVMWGSPFGETVQSYDELHAIHVRLKQHSRGGDAARFEVVRVLTPVPDVAVVQVRRTALDSDGNPIAPSDDGTGAFSEMAMYVLVRSNATWWLAAGQNTPVRPAPPR